MAKRLLITGLTLLTLGTTNCMADELDELEIKLVDESSSSTLFQKGKIVGCTDHSLKKELSCAKKPEEVILSKLPSSKQLDETNEENNDEMNGIKDQLITILAELSELKKTQQADKKTIKDLRGLIKDMSNKKSTNSNKEKLTIIQTGIKKISSNNEKKRQRKYTSTLIRKDIKEIEKNNEYVIIEVQANESLSTYAQAYYNDNTKYYRIYKANKNKIGENLQVIIGDRLTIPLAN